MYCGISFNLGLEKQIGLCSLNFYLFDPLSIWWLWR